MIIDDKTLYIVPNNVKYHLLKNNKTLKDVKFISLEELKRKILFDYDEKTIHYMIKKYNLKVDIALMYLNNMYYIENVFYKSPKLQKLKEMKDDLENNHLLIKDDLFLNSIKDRNVYVYGYDYIDKSFNKLLDVIRTITNVKIINHNDFKNKKLTVYQFDDIEDEVNFIAYSICELIDKGIDINDIKLANIQEEYKYLLKRVFNVYNIPLNIEQSTLYRTDIALTFIKLFKEYNNFEDSLNKLLELYDFNDSNNLQIYNNIINICNKYSWFDVNKDDIKDMIIYDFKNTFIKQSKMLNAIEEIPLRNNIILDDYYVFIMGFNQGVMPIIHKNEDYITDDLKDIVNLEKTYEKNNIELKICKKIISNISNVVITYKLKTKNEEFYPSSLIDEMNMDVIVNKKTDIKKTYSIIQDKLILSKKLDKLVKYDDIEDDLDILYHNYNDILYRTYDNQFTGIDKKKLIKYLDSKLRLSYSSIDEYFKCSFRYYLSNIMKIKDNEESFYLLIGNLFHYVLSFAFKPNFDFNKTWNEFLSDKDLSKKEMFFLKRLYDELQFIIDVINYQNKFSNLDKALYEEKIYIKIPNEIDVTFSGIVDKINYKEGVNSLVSIIDYKTGLTDININNVIHGLNMQLPVYLYLVKNSNKFKDPKFIGFYLQEILHNEVYFDNKKEYEDQKKDALKLKGYSIDQYSLIEEFDSTYKDSEIIKSMKVGKNGFYAYSKILNEDQMNNLVTLVGDKINKCASNIVDGDFKINPKKVGRDNASCTYCKFKDICYMKDSDIITLKEYKDISFLGGDIYE